MNLHSILVLLKGKGSISSPIWFSNLHSILVLLKVCPWEIAHIKRPEFTFHSGSIKGYAEIDEMLGGM